MSTAIPHRRNVLTDENHYVVVLEDMKELDVDIFVAINKEAMKVVPIRERLRKLEELQSTLRGELKCMSIEQLQSVHRSEKVFKRILGSFKKLK